MKVICERSALVDALGDISRVVPQRNAAEALRCVHLVAGDGRLGLAATDAEIGLRMSIDQVDIEQPGEALVPADRLTEIVRSCDDPSLTLQTDGDQLEVRSARGYFVVYGMDTAQAFTVPSGPADGQDVTISFTIEAGALGRLVDRTIFAAATENLRYAVNGVLMQRKDRTLRLVATDGHRLAVADGKTLQGAGDGRAIVPVKALSVLSRLMDAPDLPVDVRYSETQGFFRVGEGPSAAELSTNLVEGVFPPFEDVIPKDHDKKVTANVEVLARALQQASLYTNKESRGVRMSFDDHAVKLTSRVPDEGAAEVTVDLDYEGEPISIGFNAGYLTEALKVIDGGEMTLELKADNKPGVLRTGSEFTYVIMPLHLQ